MLWQVQNKAREVDKGQIVHDFIKDSGLYHRSKEKKSKVSQGKDMIQINLLKYHFEHNVKNRMGKWVRVDVEEKIPLDHVRGKVGLN